MPGSLTCVFTEPEIFEKVLSRDGFTGLLITRGGSFRARLTQITLDRLRLAAVEEELARIAFIVVPADTAFVVLPISQGPIAVWGGFEMRAGEITMFLPGERLHAITAGTANWGTLQVSARRLMQYGRALTGAVLPVPPAARWWPRAVTLKRLLALHRAAIRMAEGRSGVLADIETAHGLEQQMIHTLIECLTNGPVAEETPAARWRRWILAEFEELLRAEPGLSIAAICAALGVSDRFLRRCCEEYLHISPGRYFRLGRMQQVHRALQTENVATAKVAKIAARYGFQDLGRFTSNYRALYGELPSATLRRTGTGMAGVNLPRTV
jgi:AraC-like DNA-binding protein